MPIVSIITPAYNAAATLADTIASVRAQTFTDWEMVIIDDGSTDATAAVALQSGDARIKLLQQANAGVVAARRAGIAAATGRYIAFLDADDQWLPQKLEKQLSFMQVHGAAVSYTAYRRFDGTGNVGDIIHVPAQVDYKTLLRENVIPNLTAMIDRQVVSRIAIPNLGHEDFAMWLGILRGGALAYGLNEDLARYRVASASVSGNKLRAALWVWRIYRQQENMALPRALATMVRWGVNMLRKWTRF